MQRRARPTCACEAALPHLYRLPPTRNDRPGSIRTLTRLRLFTVTRPALLRKTRPHGLRARRQLGADLLRESIARHRSVVARNA